MLNREVMFTVSFHSGNNIRCFQHGLAPGPPLPPFATPHDPSSPSHSFNDTLRTNTNLLPFLLISPIPNVFLRYFSVKASPFSS